MAVNHERPGVYADYQVSSLLHRGTGLQPVGIAAETKKGEAGKLYTITGAAEAAALFGMDCGMTKLISVLLENGASIIHAVPTAGETAADYAAAFAVLAAEESLRLIVCDSRQSAVHAKLLESIPKAPARGAYRIGIVEGTGTAQSLIGAAAALNHERMVLVGPAAANETPGCAAAALAGLLSAEEDPALPINGAVLAGLEGLTGAFTEAELDILIPGGVTVLEQVGGEVTVVRGVTTRTKSGETPDGTWRELTTVRILDDVVPGIRDSLRSRFTRAKNTAQTRGAIRTQVILELQEKLRREIIDSYGDVTVRQDGEDPTLCLVDFQFTVAHGLNRIALTAHITV